MAPSYLFQIVGRTPCTGASEPGQKKHALTMPCFSALTQIGSPRYQLGSTTAFGSV